MKARCFISSKLIVMAVIFSITLPIAVFSQNLADKEVMVVDGVVKCNKLQIRFHVKNTETPNFNAIVRNNKLIVSFSRPFSEKLLLPVSHFKPLIKAIYASKDGRSVEVDLGSSGFHYRRFLSEDFVGVELLIPDKMVSQLNKSKKNTRLASKSGRKIIKKQYEATAEEVKQAKETTTDKNITDDTPNNDTDEKTDNKTEVKEQVINFTSAINFAWTQDTGLALFTRGDYLWAVFDKYQKVDIKKVVNDNTSLITSGDQLDNSHYTILRLKLKKSVNIAAKREGSYDWQVGFTNDKINVKPITVSISDNELSGSTVLLQHAGEEVKPLRLVDPAIGDQMVIIPIHIQGIGLEKTIKYTDFALLPTQQGAAVQLISDNVDVKVVGNNIEFAGPTNRLSSGAQSVLKELQEKEQLAKEQQEKLKNQTQDLAILKFKTWEFGGSPKTFNEDVERLLYEITEANWNDKGKPRFDLAKFYFTNALYPETLGILSVIRQYNKELSGTNEFKVIEGASNYLMGRYKEAVTIFDEINYSSFKDPDDLEEAEFWRAAANFKLTITIEMDKFLNGADEKSKNEQEANGVDKVEATRLMLETSSRLLKMIRQIDPEFANESEVQTLESTARFVASHYHESIKRFQEPENYKTGGNSFKDDDDKLWWGTSGFKATSKFEFNFVPNINKFLKYYPDQIYNDFALHSLEEKIEKGNLTDAEEMFDLFRDDKRDTFKDSVNYLKGLFYAKDEEDKKAIDSWKSLSDNILDRYNRARSIFALTVFQYQKKQLSLDDAIKQLNQIRMTWRGDVLELNILKILGELYMEKKQYLDGFRVWREIVSSFPGSEESLLVAKKMSEKFVQLFNEGYANELSKLDALTLFYEFRELTPIGKLGDDMIDKLSDRLVQLDLLDRAAAVLTHQVRFRLIGEDKDKSAIKLIKIHFLNEQPQMALDVINATERDGMAPDVALERKYLKARALVELNKNNQVLALLKDDESNRAAFLRSDVYWRQHVWRKIIEELEGPFRELRRQDKKLSSEESEQLLRLAVAYAITEKKKRLQVLYDDFDNIIEDGQKKKIFEFVVTDHGPVDFRDLDGTVQYQDMSSFISKYLSINDVPSLETPVAVKPAQ